MDQSLAHSYWESVRLDNNRVAFDKLYLVHWEELYGLAWARTADAEVAKDLVQEVFITLWEKRTQIKITTTFQQYIAGTLKYKLIDYYQSEKVKKRVFDRVYEQIEIVVGNPEFVLSYQTVEQILEEELKQMPKNMRESFLLRLDHLSVSEIARKLGLADQTVHNLLSQASDRLKKNLPQRFKNHQTLMMISFIRIVNDFLTNS